MNRKPELRVLGLYKLDVTPHLFEEQFALLYGYEMNEKERKRARTQCKRQLESIVLFETSVRKPDSNFSIYDFTQVMLGVPRDSWQAACCVTFLDSEGLDVIGYDSSELPKRDCYRCAFYLHFYDADQPLMTSYGERLCPQVCEMPTRLQQLVPFQPVD